MLLRRKRDAMKALEKPSKIKELIVHVVRRCQDDESFSLEKLARILFYADFWTYCQAGSSITGVVHRLGKSGPGPQDLRPLLRSLRDEGALGPDLDHPEALRDADTDVFSRHELCCVDEVIGRVWRLDAAAITSFPPESASA